MKHYPRLSLATAPTTLVLANGAFPTKGLGLELIDRWVDRGTPYRLVCCDGAVNQLARYTECKPTAVVGDLDSALPELKQRLADRLHHRPDQDTNDLTKTMRFVHETFASSAVALLGASGGREDHLLGNLALLPTYVDLVEDLVMITDTGYMRLITSPSSLEVEVGQQISIFSFEASPITLEGVHWPLQEHILPQLWCGTLNRADAPLIKVSSPRPLLVFVADSPCSHDHALAR